MKAICFYILFMVVALCSVAQEQFVERPAKLITQFKFRQLVGGVMMVNAQINNIKDTLNFILDTGSGGISLDSATCIEFNIPHSPSGKTINGIAGIKEVDFARNNTLKLPNLTIDSLDFYVNDYELLSSVYGIKIDGIIGYSFLSKYIVKIDFDSLNIQVLQPGTIRYPFGGTVLHPLFTTLPIQSLTIKDKRTVDANFYFDTGAGLSFLLSTAFVGDSAFVMKKRKPLEIQAQGLGGKKRMTITIIKEVSIGPYHFRRVPTHILNDEYNATSYPYVCGLIGNDILRRFNIILNYPKREIHLLPNSHFRESFDYSYTGLSLYFTDGKIYVDDVVKGSPADIAGLKVGDVVISINNNFSNNITEYCNLLQSERDHLRMLLMRDKKGLIVNLKVGKIF